MTPICELCKSAGATLMMTKVDGISQAPVLVCVDCAYEKVAPEPVGTYQLGYIKGVEHG